MLAKHLAGRHCFPWSRWMGSLCLPAPMDRVKKKTGQEWSLWRGDATTIVFVGERQLAGCTPCSICTRTAPGVRRYLKDQELHLLYLQDGIKAGFLAWENDRSLVLFGVVEKMNWRRTGKLFVRHVLRGLPKQNRALILDHVWFADITFCVFNTSEGVAMLLYAQHQHNCKSLSALSLSI